MDVLETIADYLQEDIAPSGHVQQVVSTTSTKAGQNQEALDEAVYIYIYSEDPKVRRILKGHGQNQGDPTRSNPPEPVASPQAEPTWHAQARTGTAQLSAISSDKCRSQPLRKVHQRSGGSGMQYRPRDNVPLPGQGLHRDSNKQVGEQDVKEASASTQRRS